MLGPEYVIQAAIDPPTIIFGCGPTFKELARQLGTSEEAKRQAMLSGLLFLYSLCRKEPLMACELGNDMLRAVECAQDQLERRDSWKRPVLDSRSLLRNLRWNPRRLSSQGEVVPRWQRP